MTLIVGLTGGIGSGKTATSDLFEDKGIKVVDADVIAREIVQFGSPVLHQIKSAFGSDILLPSGELNRSLLRELIFSNESHKQALNNIMQPAIRTSLLNQLSQVTTQFVILSAPLLFENNLDQYCNRVLVVDVPVSLQIERASQRDGVSVEQIQSIISSQISREQRLAKADDVIDNSGDLNNLQTQVNKIHKKYLTLSNA